MATHLRPIVERMIVHFGTQEALAEVAGVSQPAVSQWLREETKPGIRSLNRIQSASKGKFKVKKIRPELF